MVSNPLPVFSNSPQCFLYSAHRIHLNPPPFFLPSLLTPYPFTPFTPSTQRSIVAQSPSEHPCPPSAPLIILAPLPDFYIEILVFLQFCRSQGLQLYRNTWEKPNLAFKLDFKKTFTHNYNYRRVCTPKSFPQRCSLLSLTSNQIRTADLALDPTIVA